MQDLQSQKLIRTGHRKGELYVLDELKVSTTAIAAIIDLSSFCLSPSFLVFIYGILTLVIFRFLV